MLPPSLLFTHGGFMKWFKHICSYLKPLLKLVIFENVMHILYCSGKKSVIKWNEDIGEKWNWTLGSYWGDENAVSAECYKGLNVMAEEWICTTDNKN